MDADGSNQRPLGDATTFDVEPRISPDGASVVFQRFTEETAVSTLVVRDLATGQELALAAAGQNATNPAWSADGRWVAYNVGRTRERRDQVEKVAADGSGEPVVLFAGTDEVAGFKPVYSPDGERILFGCRGLDGGTTDAVRDGRGRRRRRHSRGRPGGPREPLQLGCASPVGVRPPGPAPARASAGSRA
jgi:Tol biopolymer transport system component